jgi:hypothetical protein
LERLAVTKCLSKPNIESELSYAYLHAIASRAGMACSAANRHEDNNGVDAEVAAWLPPQGDRLIEVECNIQLKATMMVPAETATHYSYLIDSRRKYDDLRSTQLQNPRLLVVLFLPAGAADWLVHSVDELVLRRCAYWVSLRGAEEIAPGNNSKTVYLPKAQTFTPDQLLELVERFAVRDYPLYAPP